MVLDQNSRHSWLFHWTHVGCIDTLHTLRILLCRKKWNDLELNQVQVCFILCNINEIIFFSKSLELCNMGPLRMILFGTLDQLMEVWCGADGVGQWWPGLWGGDAVSWELGMPPFFQFSMVYGVWPKSSSSLSWDSNHCPHLSFSSSKYCLVPREERKKYSEKY